MIKEKNLHFIITFSLAMHIMIMIIFHGHHHYLSPFPSKGGPVWSMTLSREAPLKKEKEKRMTTDHILRSKINLTSFHHLAPNSWPIQLWKEMVFS